MSKNSKSTAVDTEVDEGKKEDPPRYKARVLVDGAFGKVNDVVEVTEEQLQASAAELDGNPDAVAAALAAAE